ncbi:Longin domain [Dillenia turbinata]|uniref:Longin domain n=1 Tax=Dillenia turbinata TaxID=194707 RepID=A0AAN8ZG74_9MAGN
MVKLTMVGRVSDGLPIAQATRYLDEENDNFLYYKQQAEFILKEISMGSLPSSKMTIRVDHQYSFNYLVRGGFCFITLCGSSYPRKLAFLFLHDLHKQIQKFDVCLIAKITKPYSFVGFEMLESLMVTSKSASGVCCSQGLEVIALKWTPILAISFVAGILLWSSLILTEDLLIY